jgi:integrase
MGATKSFTPKRWKVNGKASWVIDFTENGKRTRKKFLAKTAAEDWAKDQMRIRELYGQGWINLDDKSRIAVVEGYIRSKDGGYTLSEALDFFEANRSLHTRLPKQTIHEAVDEFIADKRRIGLRTTSINGYNYTFGRFKDHFGPRQISSITLKQINQWLDQMRLNFQWSATSQICAITRVRVLFSWCVNNGYCRENPATRIEKPKLEYRPPGILTVDQTRELLATTQEIDSAMLTYIALGVFAGVRPQEILLLESINLKLDRKILEITKAKTRRRRIVHLSDNCISWLRLGQGLPCESGTWRRLKKIRDKLSFKWQHDIMRHSFCSYHVAYHRNTAMTALEAGHTETILFKHYRELVSEEDAKEFWDILPGKTGRQTTLAA